MSPMAQWCSLVFLESDDSLVFLESDGSLVFLESDGSFACAEPCILLNDLHL